MRRGLGGLCIVVGLCWAGVGVLALLTGLPGLAAVDVGGFLRDAMLQTLLPGLALAALGAWLWSA